MALVGNIINLSGKISFKLYTCLHGHKFTCIFYNFKYMSWFLMDFLDILTVFYSLSSLFSEYTHPFFYIFTLKLFVYCYSPTYCYPTAYGLILLSLFQWFLLLLWYRLNIWSNQLQTRKNMQVLSFWVCITSYNTPFLNSIHLPIKFMISFFFSAEWYSIVYIYCHCVIHLST